MSRVGQAQLREAVAEALRTTIGADVARVHPFAPDPFAPPGLVVTAATITWETDEATWCTRQWDVPVALAVPRAGDKEGQEEIDRLLDAVEDALSGPLPHPLAAARLIRAEPSNFTISGRTLPGYLINLRVIA